MNSKREEKINEGLDLVGDPKSSRLSAEHQEIKEQRKRVEDTVDDAIVANNEKESKFSVTLTQRDTG